MVEGNSRTTRINGNQNSASNHEQKVYRQEANPIAIRMSPKLTMVADKENSNNKESYLSSTLLP
jgi:hypothetical protein